MLVCHTADHTVEYKQGARKSKNAKRVARKPNRCALATSLGSMTKEKQGKLGSILSEESESAPEVPSKNDDEVHNAPQHLAYRHHTNR